MGAGTACRRLSRAPGVPCGAGDEAVREVGHDADAVGARGGCGAGGRAGGCAGSGGDVRRPVVRRAGGRRRQPGVGAVHGRFRARYARAGVLRLHQRVPGSADLPARPLEGGARESPARLGPVGDLAADRPAAAKISRVVLWRWGQVLRTDPETPGTSPTTGTSCRDRHQQQHRTRVLPDPGRPAPSCETGSTHAMSAASRVQYDLNTPVRAMRRLLQPSAVEELPDGGQGGSLRRLSAGQPEHLGLGRHDPRRRRRRA